MERVKSLTVLFIAVVTVFSLGAQGNKENMPAGIAPEQQWWNLLHYDINIRPDYKRKFISGSNKIEFSAIRSGNSMQVDLMEPMKITDVVWAGIHLRFSRTGNKYYLHFNKNIPAGSKEIVTLYFEGIPQEAVKPPWGSGWIWATDKLGRPWISAACEGTGAAIWLPCKNPGYDEPDKGVDFSITVPDTLVAVANGRLTKKQGSKSGTTIYTWSVTSPINNYNMIASVGKYVSWHKNFPGKEGNLDCDYWVLDYNIEKAKQHFLQADTMLQCFEDWLGPYPFYKDSYKLVETPFVGMEHQSGIAYGNGFENGYRLGNLSGTAWGLKWDFLLVHESGHEWFGNSITASNGGESWIHEGFTKYLETIYNGYLYGTEAGNDYSIGIWKRIKNDEPVLGSGSSDAYNKGSALLHMMRQILGDTLFKGMLRYLSKTFYHSTVNTAQILREINLYTKHDFTHMFDQYLHTTKVPVLEYSFKGDSLLYRWVNCVDGFDMPVNVSIGEGHQFFIYPATSWNKMAAGKNDALIFKADRNFYLELREQKLY